MIIATYKIRYANSITQTKNLISQTDYTETVKPILQEIDDLLAVKENLAASKLKSKLKSLVGNFYFTTESPLYFAIDTGLLILPKHQGGESKCELVKIT